MPEWVVAVTRLLGAPSRWIANRVRRRALDRHDFVRGGSSAVTPLIQLVKGIGPESIVLGTDEENGAYLNECQTKWMTMRDGLMEYANQHPSDRVRELAHEVERAVWKDLQLTAWLLRDRRTATTMDSFHASEAAHADALHKTELLMTKIRAY